MASSTGRGRVLPREQSPTHSPFNELALNFICFWLDHECIMISWSIPISLGHTGFMDCEAHIELPSSLQVPCFMYYNLLYGSKKCANRFPVIHHHYTYTFLWAVELIDIARWTSPGFLRLTPSIAGVSWAPVDRTTTTTRAPVPLELAGAESLRFDHGQDLGTSVNETVILLFIIMYFSL